MKVFNGKQAAEDYMSSHTLAFSTPDLTLKRFSFWLGDIVPDPKDKEQTIPRLMTYIEEQDFKPVPIIDDDTYVATGAVRSSGIYGNTETQTRSVSKFCSQCGIEISNSAQFCPDCGSNQD